MLAGIDRGICIATRTNRQIKISDRWASFHVWWIRGNAERYYWWNGMRRAATWHQNQSEQLYLLLTPNVVHTVFTTALVLPLSITEPVRYSLYLILILWYSQSLAAQFSAGSHRKQLNKIILSKSEPFRHGIHFYILILLYFKCYHTFLHLKWMYSKHTLFPCQNSPFIKMNQMGHMEYITEQGPWSSVLKQN